MNEHDHDGRERARLAQAWAAARYHVHTGDEALPLAVGGALVAFAVGETAAAVERRWPATRYLFISACNPGAVIVPAWRNQRADRLLQQQLRQQGLAMQPASACDADGNWHESGWLLRQATLAQADWLARAFGQGGVLVWDAGQAVRLRMMWPRPAAAAQHPSIDWVS